MLIRSLTLAVVLAGLLASDAATQSVVACTTKWSKPYAPMVGDGYLYLNAPQMVALPNGLALFGDNAFAAAPTYAGFIPIAGWPRGEDMIAGFLIPSRGEVTPIPGPPGVRAFIEVRAAATPGVAHVFWGGSADTTSSQFLRINSLWYARYDGRDWTSPELILADSTLNWAHQLTSVTASGSHVHLTALVDGDSLSPDVLHVVRGADGTGRVSRLGFQALYTDLHIDRSGALWLSTIAGQHPDRARVLVRRSTDEGHTWTEPVVAYRSGRGTAYDPRLALTPSGTAYLTWLIEPRGGVRERIGIARSTDHGASWDRLPDITGLADARDLWASPDGDTSVQLAFHTDDDGGRVTVMRLQGSEREFQPGHGPTWHAASLAAPRRDSLYLAWFEPRIVGPEQVPTLWVSRRRSCLE